MTPERPQGRAAPSPLPEGVEQSGKATFAREAQASAGALLRTAREKQGLHIAALAAAIKVSPKKLEALEADRHDELAGAIFTRALAQSVCRVLRIDAKPVLALLPQPDASVLENVTGPLNAPFRDRASRDDRPLVGVAQMVLVGAGVALMIAAAALFLWPQAQWTTATPMPVASAAAAASAASAVSVLPQVPALAASAMAAAVPALPVDVAASAPLSTPAALAPAPAAVAATTAAATVPAAATPLPLSTTAQPPAAAPTPPAAAPTPPAAVPTPLAAVPTPLAAPTGPLQIQVSAASWVEVRERGGRLLLSRLLQPGESTAFDGAFPMRLTIGNATATRITLRGKPVELNSVSRDNVARLELN